MIRYFKNTVNGIQFWKLDEANKTQHFKVGADDKWNLAAYSTGRLERIIKRADWHETTAEEAGDAPTQLNGIDL